MAIISFWGNEEKETGQTISMLSIASTMAIEHNHKIIAIGTGFKDNTISDAFWAPELSMTESVQSKLGLENEKNIGTISGVEGLSMVVQSGRVGNDIVGNYTKPVFKDKRLDVLLPPETISKEEYDTICKNYPKILKMANNDYNMVFVDVCKKMPMETQMEILRNSDLIIVGIKQGLNSINKFIELKKHDQLFNGRNIMVFIGKYDGYSKYNLRNIERYLKGKNIVLGISYNTLFYESATEGKLLDYTLRIRNITNTNDRNYVFVQQNKYACENILYKLKELQVR